ncbi:hypothetical protein ACFO3D_11390 [Virgibacillus kekensis]|uniref:Uncharacterized protein n=1 Tax=Virgibacillus kekensis TaxID=202261 RepID=A0ABV9DLW4_9BACI
MRIFLVLTFAVSAAAAIFKWRYRIVNTLLAVSFLRRVAVMISMNMPEIRQRILPGLFSRPSN